MIISYLFEWDFICIYMNLLQLSEFRFEILQNQGNKLHKNNQENCRQDGIPWLFQQKTSLFSSWFETLLATRYHVLAIKILWETMMHARYMKILYS